jgi:hypothetical protein
MPDSKTSLNPDVLMWRGKARYRPHFTDMQEPSGVEKRDMTITNNTPREALWTKLDHYLYMDVKDLILA